MSTTFNDALNGAIQSAFTAQPELEKKYAVGKRDRIVYYKKEEDKNSFERISTQRHSLSDLVAHKTTINTLSKEKEYSRSGFVKTHYLFIEKEYNPYYKSDEAYKHTLEKFDLKPDEPIIPDVFIKITNYRESLHKQILRQATLVRDINNEIISVLKVLLEEAEGFIFHDNLYGLLVLNIDSFINTDLLNGSYSNHIDFTWIDTLQGKNDLYSHLSYTSLKAIMSLLKERDSIIEMAIKLASLVTPLEAIIEDLIIGNKLLSPREYLHRTLPNPEVVAQQFRDKAHNPQFPLNDISQVMAAFQDFYVRNKDLDYNRKLNFLGKMILNDEHIVWSDNKPNIKTVKNWIEVYAEEIYVSFK